MMFLIGPGGIGKTTLGPFVAKLLGYNSIDLDLNFCEKFGDISQFIKNHGYEEYVFLNFRCFDDLLNYSNGTKYIFALSSGFLVSEHVRTAKTVGANRIKVKKNGTSVLILPANNNTDAASIVVNRQLTRGFGFVEHKERPKFPEMEKFPFFPIDCNDSFLLIVFPSIQAKEN